MMKLTFLLFLFYLILPFCNIACADMRTAHAEWTMTEPVATDLAGFKIFADGEMVADVADPTMRQHDFQIDVLGPEISFTMTSYDTAGQESKHSEPVIVNPRPGVPLIIYIDGL